MSVVPSMRLCTGNRSRFGGLHFFFPLLISVWFCYTCHSGYGCLRKSGVQLPEEVWEDFSASFSFRGGETHLVKSCNLRIRGQPEDVLDFWHKGDHFSGIAFVPTRIRGTAWLFLLSHEVVLVIYLSFKHCQGEWLF